MMARDFLYHVWDSPKFDGQPALAAVDFDVPKNGRKPNGKTETKRMYSLKRDLEALREAGVKKGIVDPSFVALDQKSNEGRELFGIKIGKDMPKHKVLLTGCHHSREWISVEVPYYLAEYLINNFTDTPKTEEEKRIKHLVTNREIWIIPMCNPDGHMFTIQENRWWRANRKVLDFPKGAKIEVAKTRKRTIQIAAGKKFTGVDINRNYATSDWGEETYHPGSSQRATSRDPAEGGADAVFCGMTAGSEPETQALSKLISDEKFDAMLTYHNFGQDYIFPDQVSGNAYLTELKDGMKKLVAQHGNPYNFRASANYRYKTSGDAMVFYTETVPLRPAYVPEVRPKGDAPIVLMFSGLAESQIKDTVIENLAAALALINAAAFDKAPHDVTAKADAKNPIVQVVRGSSLPFEGWKPTL